MNQLENLRELYGTRADFYYQYIKTAHPALDTVKTTEEYLNIYNSADRNRLLNSNIEYTEINYGVGSPDVDKAEEFYSELIHLDDKNKDGKITLDERKDLARFDMDNDGELTAREYAVSAMAMDADNDGTLSVMEQMMFIYLSGDPNAKVDQKADDIWDFVNQGQGGQGTQGGNQGGQINQNAAVWGDPHFKFVDKTGKVVQIDHKGIDGETYRILEAEGLTIDAEYRYYKETAPQMMGAVSIKAGNQTLVCHQNTVKLDGKTLENGDYTLADGTKITVFKNGYVNIHPTENDSIIQVKSQRKGSYYDLGVQGELGNSETKYGYTRHKDIGGVLGFFIEAATDMSRQEILEEYDKDNNGRLTNDELPNDYKVEDLGYFQY